MKTKYNYGFVGLENWEKSEDSKLNKCISLLIEKSLTVNSEDYDYNCEQLFNTKKYFIKGSEICKKYGLSALIMSVCYRPDVNGSSELTFNFISFLKNGTDNVSEAESFEKFLESRSLGKIIFRTKNNNDGTVILKKNGKYIPFEHFEYIETDSEYLERECLDNIMLDYIKLFPLKSRRIADKVYCFEKDKEDDKKDNSNLDDFDLMEYLENYEPEDEICEEESEPEEKNKRIRPAEEAPEESFVIKDSDDNETFNLVKDNKIKKREINKDFNGNIKIKLNDMVGCVHCGKKYPASELLVYQSNKNEKIFLIFCKNRPYCDGNICDIFSADDEDFKECFTE